MTDTQAAPVDTTAQTPETQEEEPPQETTPPQQQENNVEAPPKEENKEEAEEVTAVVETETNAETETAAAETETATEEKKMTGRTVIVTGASSGLGYEVARYLCEGGNDVILACRNEDKAKRAIDKIKRQNPNALATFMALDLASAESVRKFVDDFHESEKKLHVLVNNAGVCPSVKDTKRQYTKENFELTMGTNHLGHFLLTNLLLEDLKKAGGEENGDARIVVVSSSWHDPETMKRRNKQMRDVQALDLENLFLFNDGTYNGLQAYKNSKVANIMFMYELARRLEGSGVTVNAINPGYIPSTDLLRNASGAQKFYAKYILHGMLRFAKITRSVAQGANAICSLATDEKFKGQSGKYFQDGNEAQSSTESKEEEKQTKLWEMSGGYLQMEGFKAIEVPEPPKEEEKKVEDKKEEEKKEGEEAATQDGDVKAAETGDNKTDEEKQEQEVKKEEIEEEKEEKKDDEKEKSDEKADVKEETEDTKEEKKEESADETVKVEENKE